MSSEKKMGSEGHRVCLNRFFVGLDITFVFFKGSCRFMYQRRAAYLSSIEGRAPKGLVVSRMEPSEIDAVVRSIGVLIVFVRVASWFVLSDTENSTTKRHEQPRILIHQSRGRANASHLKQKAPALVELAPQSDL